MDENYHFQKIYYCLQEKVKICNECLDKHSDHGMKDKGYVYDICQCKIEN